MIDLDKLVRTQLRFDTSDLIAPGQIGWVYYPEGRAIVAAKVVRIKHGMEPIISLPTLWKRGTAVQAIYYPQMEEFMELRRVLLAAFREAVGEDYYFNFEPPRVKTKPYKKVPDWNND